MLQDYDYVMQHVFADEGGYGWDKGDPGGPTKYGITCYDLAEHRGQKMTSMTTWAPIVKDMQKPEAEDIYKTKYAIGCRFNELNPGKDYVIVDYGINSGIARPIRVAQTILKLPVTGKFDEATLVAINKADPTQFINAIQNERLSFMKSIKNGTMWEEFGGGWGKRVASVRQISLQLALNETEKMPTPVNDGSVPSKKAQHQTDGENIFVKTILGAIASLGGLIPALNTYAPNGFNLELGVGVAGVAAVVGLLCYIWHEQHINTLNNTVVLPSNEIKTVTRTVGGI